MRKIKLHCILQVSIKKNLRTFDISMMFKKQCRSRFHGWVSSDQLHTMYTESHFLFKRVNQANISNFPMKLIELLSFGILPILSDVGDYGKMISDGVDGFVVPTGNLDAAVDCLERVTMLSEREYQLTTNA